MTAAAARAAHLIVDSSPLIFLDSLAEALLGDRADELLEYHRAHGQHVVLAGARTQTICRSRYAEDRLARGSSRGIRQYVILGAGLDSYAYRCGPTSAVRVFEVDHPATQEWKRDRLAAAGIPIPPTVTYVPVDLEVDPLADHLTAGGFDPDQPALVSWLGVSMYLSRAAIAGTLAVVGSLAPGTEIVLDYMLPADLRDAAGQTYVELVGPVTAERGEPWQTFLAPPELSTLLAEHGFEQIEHVRQHDAVDAGLWNRSDCLRPAALSCIAAARVRSRVAAA